MLPYRVQVVYTNRRSRQPPCVPCYPVGGSSAEGCHSRSGQLASRRAGPGLDSCPARPRSHARAKSTEAQRDVAAIRQHSSSKRLHAGNHHNARAPRALPSPDREAAACAGELPPSTRSVPRRTYYLPTATCASVLLPGPPIALEAMPAASGSLAPSAASYRAG